MASADNPEIFHFVPSDTTAVCVNSGFLLQTLVLPADHRITWQGMTDHMRDIRPSPSAVKDVPGPKSNDLIYDISADITVNEGSNVSLICTASGKPEPSISWRHITPSGEVTASLWYHR
ncbi:unnamed protein product [Boreogadus saida]